MSKARGLFDRRHKNFRVLREPVCERSGPGLWGANDNKIGLPEFHILMSLHCHSVWFPVRNLDRTFLISVLSYGSKPSVNIKMPNIPTASRARPANPIKDGSGQS